MIYDEIKRANVEAMKNHDSNARAVFSVLMSKIKLAEIDKRAEGGVFGDEDVIKILQKSLKELAEEREAFAKAGRSENVAALDGQMAIVQKYLPIMMSDEEIAAVIASLPDKSVPFVMKHFKANYAGKCDMRRVQAVLAAQK